MEETTQGNLAAMEIYAIAAVPMILMLVGNKFTRKLQYPHSSIH